MTQSVLRRWMYLRKYDGCRSWGKRKRCGERCLREVFWVTGDELRGRGTGKCNLSCEELECDKTEKLGKNWQENVSLAHLCGLVLKETPGWWDEPYNVLPRKHGYVQYAYRAMISIRGRNTPDNSRVLCAVWYHVSGVEASSSHLVHNDRRRSDKLMRAHRMGWSFRAIRYSVSPWGNRRWTPQNPPTLCARWCGKWNLLALKVGATADMSAAFLTFCFHLPFFDISIRSISSSFFWQRRHSFCFSENLSLSAATGHKRKMRRYLISLSSPQHTWWESAFRSNVRNPQDCDGVSNKQ